MTYKFFLLKKEEAKDPTKCGYAFIKNNPDRLLSVAEDVGQYVLPGFNVGNDFIIHEDICYMVKKSFLNIEEDTSIILAIESQQGCDRKESF